MEKIYSTREWKTLEGVDRAQLLLVIEGLKKGTIIDGNWSGMIDILQQTGLDYQLNTEPLRLRPVMEVARRDDLKNYNIQQLLLPENAPSSEYHRITGEFLGYPKCCTEEYINGQTYEQWTAAQNGLHHVGYRYGQELTDKIEREGAYPDIFDFRPPAYTPCSIECDNAKTLLTSWREAIMTHDPEAGEALMRFNRQDFPERLVHKKYFEKKLEESRRAYWEKISRE